jgi:protein subunit release factor A
MREKLAAPSSPLDVLLDVREGKTGAEHVLETHDSVELFAQYLEFIRKMVEYVDRMEDHK